MPRKKRRGRALPLCGSGVSRAECTHAKGSAGRGERQQQSPPSECNKEPSLTNKHKKKPRRPAEHTPAKGEQEIKPWTPPTSPLGTKVVRNTERAGGEAPRTQSAKAGRVGQAEGGKKALPYQGARGAASGSRVSLYIAQVLHLVLVPLLGHFALVLFALQVLPELHLLAGAGVAHGAVELAAGGDTHGEVARDPLTGARVEIRACEEEAERRDYFVR